MPENKAWGKITKKAPVGQPISTDSKVKFFEIEATVDSFIVIPGPGLSAECRVILKRVPEAIVIPQIAIFEEDSMKVVYVKTKNGFELRQIETGVSSPKEAVITKGLAKDERIALSKPQIAIINQKKLLPDSTTKKVIENKNPKQNNIQLK
jgi:multidrug efflux pump subunit AcrA (membrane-fusion protein)